MCFLPPITKVLGQHLHDGASALPRLDDAAMTVALLALVASAALADDAALRTVAVDDAGDTFLGAPATYAYAAYAHPWPHPALAFEANFSVSFPAARRCGRPRVAACVLRRRNTCGTGCHYFQHAAVYLAPCLSFFARYDDLEPVVVARDGLYFGFHPWTVGFLEAAGTRLVQHRAGKESEIPNFKGSYLGRFPLVSADLWTSDHLSERSRRVDAFFLERAEHAR